MKISLALQRAWYRPGSWAGLLLPLSWPFRGLVALRRRRLQHANPPLPVPVVVVGNISVGGTGKTPLLAALVAHFQALGYRPGIVSRGYGGHAAHYPLLVSRDCRADQVGDEPLLLAAYCPVAVDPDRYRAACFLLAQTDCNLLFSDDGLQHYRLPRDIEVVVVDGERGFGNGHCLPAGPLREPLSRLKQADFVLVNETVASRQLAGAEGFRLAPLQLRQLLTGAVVAADQWQGSREVHAVAGIGNPARFARSLQLLGFTARLHALPDHHDYRGDELDFDDDLPVIITAKDAVKCAAFAADNVWVLDVVAELGSRFLTRLEQRVAAINTGRLASINKGV
ncbi:tetraacyldisaccharide 4'-kinase [Porticoccus sp.]